MAAIISVTCSLLGYVYIHVPFVCILLSKFHAIGPALPPPTPVMGMNRRRRERRSGSHSLRKSFALEQ